MPGKNCTVDMALCPDCVQHVRYCAGRSEDTCPFCEASFSPTALAGSRPSAGAVPQGLKKGALAASFVGATMMATASFGCVPVAEYGGPVPDNSYEEQADAGHDAEEEGDADESDTDESDTDQTEGE